MRHPLRCLLAVSSAFLSFSVAAILAQGPQAASALKVAVLAGDGRVHNLRQPVPAEVVVEVRDSNANPLKEAIVVFQLPASGPSGLFADDSLFASVVTDEQGRAVVRGLKPNSVVGRWEIAVTVSYQGASSNAWIAQMNEEAAARPVVRKTGRGGSGKIVAIVVLVAAAAGGGIAAAALSGKKNTTTSTSPGPTVPATTGATISITTITVGAPP